MLLPSYTITNLILDYLIKYEVALEHIKNTPLPHTHKEELEANIQVDDIQNLSELIGSPIQFQQADQVQRGKVLSSNKVQLQVFTNYRSATDFAKSYNKDSFIPPSAELLSHINKLVTKKILEEWEGGKFRSFSEKPNELYDKWYKQRDFFPNHDLANHFDDFFRWFEDRKNRTHKLIQLTIFLYEMIDKAPLQGGNQITSVVALSILAKSTGYNPEGLFSFAKALNFIGEDVISAFKMAKGNRDLTPFLEAVLYTLSLEMLNLEDIYIDTFNTKIKKQGKLKAKFNSRQIKILEFLENVDRVTRKEYSKMMGVSFMTSYRDLQHLVDEKYLTCKGTGRGTYYKLIKKTEIDTKKPELQVFGS